LATVGSKYSKNGDGGEAALMVILLLDIGINAIETLTYGKV
jgi:hypothetical protein